MEWSWGSALIGTTMGIIMAAIIIAITAFIILKPKIPGFEVQSLQFSNITLQELSIIAKLHIINPTCTAIKFGKLKFSVSHKNLPLCSSKVEGIVLRESATCSLVKLDFTVNWSHLLDNFNTTIVDTIEEKKFEIDINAEANFKVKLMRIEKEYRFNLGTEKGTVNRLPMDMLDHKKWHSIKHTVSENHVNH